MEVIIFLIIGLFVAEEAGVLNRSEPSPPPVVKVISGPRFIVKDIPVYQRNHYYKDEKAGYYISDLSSNPEKPE